MGHTIAAKRNQFLCFSLLLRFEYDQSFGHFSPLAIRHADHRSFQDCRMFVEHGLHFY